MYDNRKKDSQASKKNKTKAEVAAEKAINGYKSIKDLYPWKQNGLPLKQIKT